MPMYSNTAHSLRFIVVITALPVMVGVGCVDQLDTSLLPTDSCNAKLTQDCSIGIVPRTAPARSA